MRNSWEVNLNPLAVFIFCLCLLALQACTRESPSPKQGATPVPVIVPPESSPAGPPPPPSPGGRDFPKGFFSVKGVSLWSTLEDVANKLGPPLKTKRWTEKDTMMPGEHLKLDYPGLSLELYKDPPKDFYIWRMAVTGKNWSASPGLQVGMEINEAQKKLKPLDLQRAPEEDSMSACGLLEGTDACVWIKFKENLVTEMGLMEDWS